MPLDNGHGVRRLVAEDIFRKPGNRNLLDVRVLEFVATPSAAVLLQVYKQLENLKFGQISDSSPSRNEMAVRKHQLITKCWGLV